LEYIRQIVQNVTKSSCAQSAMIEDELVMDDFSPPTAVVGDVYCVWTMTAKCSSS